MKWCSSCVLPDTRPNLFIGADGVCNACKNSRTKKVIDWDKRQESWSNLVDNVKSLGREYDCLIPVSGGKDSTWQVIKCLESGLKPLTVTWRTPGRTSIGTANLENLVQLGVDHIDFTINPDIESRFMLRTFKTKGSTAIPMHLAIFNIPLRFASMYNIPLIVWGENSAFEYGQSEDSDLGFSLDSTWKSKYGVTNGTTSEDWVGDNLSLQDLSPYRHVNLGSTIKGIFLGYYFQWDPLISRQVASQSGFKSAYDGPKTGLYDFADIDDDFISIHHFLKWYKFGFTRLFDNLSIEIRNSRISRDKALNKLSQIGLQVPIDDIQKASNFMDIKETEFFDICESFRNHSIWSFQDGMWVMKDFIVDVNWELWQS